ncbi:unnamed protein product [Allacma fusca]|uniref:Uncharacterized protein n=1 Tax=Allacma fusca TaxID=39272 RepID=A0A8J2JP64_9HEXA|nr:unnamed protein product [Allacma fusca]
MPTVTRARKIVFIARAENDFIPCLSSTSSEKHYFRHCSLVQKRSEQVQLAVENLNRQHLVIEMKSFEPHLIENSKREPIGGITWTLLNTLSQNYNFTFTRKIAKTEVTSNLNLTQSIKRTPKALLKDLIENRIDMVLPFGKTLYLSQLLDFTRPIIDMNLFFFTAKPKVTIKWAAVFYPFDTLVWILILTISMLVVMFYTLRIKLFQTSYLNQSSVILIPINIHLQQNLTWLGKKRYYYLVLLFLFYSVIINIYYNSNLLAFITFPEQETVPKSVEELLASDYKIIFWTIPGEMVDYFFKKTTAKRYVQLRDKYEFQPSKYKCILAGLYEPKTVCLMIDFATEASIAKNATLNSIPTEYSKRFLSFVVGMVLQKNSRYFLGFEYAIYRLTEAGIIRQWYHISIEMLRQLGIRADSKKRSVKQETDNPSPLTVNNFIVAFLFWASGIFAAGAVAIFEVQDEILRAEYHPEFQRNIATSDVKSNLNLTQPVKRTPKALLKDLIENRIDMVVPVGKTLYLNQLLDFTRPIIDMNLFFFTAKPKVTIKWAAVFYPFDTLVWILILTISMLVVMFYTLRIKLFQTSYLNQSSVILIPINIHLQQNLTWLGKKRYYYLVLLFLFYSVIINIYYNSNLLAFITFPEQETVPKTVEELLASDYRIKFWTIPGEMVDDFFKKTTGKRYVQLREQYGSQPFRHECILAGLYEPKTVCLMVDFASVTTIARNATLNSIPTNYSKRFLSFMVGMVLQKNSKYLIGLDNAIYRLTEAGIITRWYHTSVAMLHQL